MKRTGLVRRIASEAREQGVIFELLCGSTRVVILRHREISELTARRIMRDLDELFGKGWSR